MFLQIIEQGQSFQFMMQKGSIQNIQYSILIIQLKQNKYMQNSQPRKNPSVNKFMSNISSEILNQNYHYKTEIIKMKKILNNYQNLMVQQFIKLAQSLGLSAPEGYVFDAPQKYLTFFIQMVNKYANNNKTLLHQKKQMKVQHVNIKAQNERKTQKIQLLTLELQEKQKIIRTLEENKTQIEDRNKYLQKEFEQFQQKRNKQRIQYKSQIEKMQIDSNTKILQQKKALMQKFSKQIASYREQMDMQLHKKQKQMRLQNERRDRQAKSLLSAITSLIQNREKEEKAKEKERYKNQGVNIMRSVQLPNTNNSILTVSRIRPQQKVQEKTQTLVDKNISILADVIKPFTEHTNMLQKLSQCRKQNMQLKNQNRQNSSLLSSLKLSLSSTQNDMLLYKQQSTSLKKINEELSQSNIKLKSEVEKAIFDLKSMQKYYDQRWNSQFNKVKHQLQKKHEIRMKELEDQYTQLKNQLQQKKLQIKSNVEGYKAQIQNMKRINLGLFQKIAQQEIIKQVLNNKLNEQRRITRQCNSMHKQQISSLKYHYLCIKNDVLMIVETKQAVIQKLLKKIQQIKLEQKKIQESIKQTCQEKIKKIIIQKQQQNKQILLAKDQKISKLIQDIEAHKKTIQSLIKEQPHIRQVITEKMQKQKQKQIKLVKVSHLQQLNKYIQKIGKLQQKVKQSKVEIAKKQSEFYLAILQKQRRVNQIIVKNKQIQQAYKLALDQIVNFQNQRQNFRNTINFLESALNSLRVQSKSHSLIIKQKESCIQKLILDKESWFNNLKQCKIQFQKGFKQMRQIHQKKINFFRSRIWELQHLNELGITSKKDFQTIKNLTDDNKKLQQILIQKQAQNLVLKQVNTYYQKKASELDSKMTIQFELREPKRQLVVRKPKRDKKQMRVIKTQVSQFCEFESSDGLQIKKLSTKADVDISANIKGFTNRQQVHSASKSVYRTKTRINSSMM